MNSNRAQFLQGPFLKTLRAQAIPVGIYLVNGIRLNGTISSFDQYTLELHNSAKLLVYKSAVACIVPSRPFVFGVEDQAPNDEKVQDAFLDLVKTNKIQVDVFLVNDTPLVGVITYHDDFCLILEGESRIQMVYKHAIARVVAPK